MGWREKMGAVGDEHLKPHTQNTQNTQKGVGVRAFESIEDIEHRFENVKSYPVPDTEKAFSEDERQAIQDVDGGQDTKPVEYPVEVKMDSSILGATVDVMLWPDRAEFDGVAYSNSELTDLKSRGLSAADLRAVHEVKKQFNGTVIP